MSRIEKPSVLLVDDNEPTCTLMTALLQRDFTIDVATDGIEAIERLKTNSFAAVLLDLRMPQLDGFGVLEFLEDNAPAMIRKTIVVTAALQPRELNRAKSFGVWGVIKKPFDVDALLTAVRSCTSQDGGRLSTVLCSSGPVLLLLADLLRQRLL